MVNRGKAYSLIAAVTWSAALIFLCIWSLPAPEVFVFSLADKVKHAAAYGALGILWARVLFAAYGRARWTLAAAAAGYAFIWGALTEFIQSAVPGRNADVNDLIADAVGVVICVAAYWWANPGGREAETG